jgi:uncharacterized membrane protein
MNPLAVAGVVFGCTFGGALVGTGLRRVLPDPHLTSDCREVVKMGTALVASMAALVLGLLTASAKSTFDAQKAGFQQMATTVVLLDRTLAHYGPDAAPARDLLRRSVAAAIDDLWPAAGARSPDPDAEAITRYGTDLHNAIRDLAPRTDAQKLAQAQAAQLCNDLGRTRWMLSQRDDDIIPTPLVAVLVFWLTVLFVTFGLFSPGNATVMVVLLVCSLSVAGALLLIVDMSQPFVGLFQISRTPLAQALAHLGK